jgi:hypothetical protein
MRVNKRSYAKPVVTRVRLDLKTSVLVVCRLSLEVDPQALNCKPGWPVPCRDA